MARLYSSRATLALAILCTTCCFGQLSNTTEAAKVSLQAKEVLLLMGTRFEIGAVSFRQSAADSAVQLAITEIKRIEALISSWNPSSQTSQVNQAAGIAPVKVDRELFDLIRRANKVSALTNGAFDITAGGFTGLYRFGGQDTVLPDINQRLRAVELIGYEQIVLNPSELSVYLQKPGMRMGFGAIGKGYAANRAREVMRAVPGITGGVVNASGDLATFGKPPTKPHWTIGIADPRRLNTWLGQVALDEMSIVTSGDYEKFFTADEIRYSHIIDPRSALPTHRIASATVVCPDAELADALATAVFVLGPKDGILLLDRLRNVEGLVVTTSGELLTSRNLTLQAYED